MTFQVILSHSALSSWSKDVVEESLIRYTWKKAAPSGAAFRIRINYCTTSERRVASMTSLCASHFEARAVTVTE